MVKCAARRNKVAVLCLGTPFDTGGAVKLDNVYWSWDASTADGGNPSILAIGDSWFWYPLPGGSLITQLGKLVNRDHYILAVGNNGAEAVDYVDGKYRKDVRRQLGLHGPSLSAVFISGGGNDFAGFCDLRPMLRDDCSSARQAAQCFRPGNEPRSLEWLLGKTADSHRALIGQIMAAVPPAAKIVLHNYDYAQPTGKGVFGKNGSWLKPALDDANVPEALQAACVRHVIDEMTTRFQALTAIDPDRIFLVDSAGTLGPDDWANELHPKVSGFRKIAKQCWEPVLNRIGLT